MNINSNDSASTPDPYHTALNLFFSCREPKVCFAKPLCPIIATTSHINERDHSLGFDGFIAFHK